MSDSQSDPAGADRPDLTPEELAERVALDFIDNPARTIYSMAVGIKRIDVAVSRRLKTLETLAEKSMESADNLMKMIRLLHENQDAIRRELAAIRLGFELPEGPDMSDWPEPDTDTEE